MKGIGYILGVLAGLLIWATPVYLAAINLRDSDRAHYDRSADNFFALYFFIIGPAIGFFTGKAIVSYFGRLQEHEDRKLADEKERLAKQQARRKANANEKMLLDSVATDLSAAYETLEPLLDQAALHVTRAESELNDDSVGAFWDEVEAATRRFAQYNNSISVIHKLVEDHSRRRAALPTEFQPDALEPQALPDGDHLLSRMAKIVKQARRNPQWETIFQQRRTNDILVKGFECLGDAMESLQDTISSGFNDLADVLHSTVERISSEHSDRVITELNQLAETHSEDSRERRRFEQNVRANADKAVQVLEKIENRRRYG